MQHAAEQSTVQYSTVQYSTAWWYSLLTRGQIEQHHRSTTCYGLLCSALLCSLCYGIASRFSSLTPSRAESPRIRRWLAIPVPVLARPPPLMLPVSAAPFVACALACKRWKNGSIGGFCSCGILHFRDGTGAPAHRRALCRISLVYVPGGHWRRPHISESGRSQQRSVT
jgi:hypothetical protein